MTQSASKEATSEPDSGATVAKRLLQAGNLQEALEAAQTVPFRKKVITKSNWAIRFVPEMPISVPWNSTVR
jgi:hypothetical protein